MEEGGKIISLTIQVPKNLQKRAPIIVVGSLLHHVSPSCGWCGPALPRLLATYLTVAAHNGAHPHPATLPRVDCNSNVRRLGLVVVVQSHLLSEPARGQPLAVPDGLDGDIAHPLKQVHLVGHRAQRQKDAGTRCSGRHCDTFLLSISPFSPIFPHFPPFSPIFPHFPPFPPIFPWTCGSVHPPPRPPRAGKIFFGVLAQRYPHFSTKNLQILTGGSTFPHFSYLEQFSNGITRSLPAAGN